MHSRSPNRLCAAALALALSGTALAQEPQRGKLEAPPLRLETRLVLRQDMNPGTGFQIATQIVRTERVTSDLGLTWTLPHNLALIGPQRGSTDIEGSVDAVVALSKWVAVGPVAGVSYRIYRQQWTPVDEVWVPTLGAVSRATLLAARTWRFTLTLTGTADLAQTQLVLDTQEVRTLHPFALHIGLRFHLGGLQHKQRDES